MASFDTGMQILKKKFTFIIYDVFGLVLQYQLQMKTDFFLQLKSLKVLADKGKFLYGLKLLRHFCSTLSNLKDEMPYRTQHH